MRAGLHAAAVKNGLRAGRHRGDDVRPRHRRLRAFGGDKLRAEFRGGLRRAFNKINYFIGRHIKDTHLFKRPCRQHRLQLRGGLSAGTEQRADLGHFIG
ncbi:hypothetical protein SDC9_184138 [bioreactor metagenome]|uniref:Uncharacterized protein n=1 Tax=bioreactor metagenome TaxID=1076179 RepID=A0A645HC73_9ZZZZ